jgi:hypothetical protein
LNSTQLLIFFYCIFFLLNKKKFSHLSMSHKWKFWGDVFVMSPNLMRKRKYDFKTQYYLFSKPIGSTDSYRSKLFFSSAFQLKIHRNLFSVKNLILGGDLESVGFKNTPLFYFLFFIEFVYITIIHLYVNFHWNMFSNSEDMSVVLFRNSAMYHT